MTLFNPPIKQDEKDVAAPVTSRIDPRQLRPLHDLIILRRIEEPPKGLIVLSDKEKSEVCEVIAVGPGKNLRGEDGETSFLATTLKPGDRVIIGGYVDYECGGENFLICHEADVRAVIDA